MESLRIDVWSDLACPWCYVGKRRLDAALARFARRDAVEIVWRSFELDPAARHEPGVSYLGRLESKYGRQAEQMLARMTQLGGTEGIPFHFERARPANTFDAHRVLHMAAASGVQLEAKARLFRAHFTEGEDLALHETLARLAGDVGLDAIRVRAELATDAHAVDVRADEEQAARLGIRGVPFFVLGGRIGVSGAQPPDLLLQAIEQAWQAPGSA